MLRALLRLVLALGGAAAAAFFVALLEARVVSVAQAESGSGVAPLGALLLAELGILLPVVLGVGGGVGVLSVLLEPGLPKTPAEHVTALREGAMLERLRAAAAAPLVVLATFAWCVASAHVARVALAEGKPAEAGLTVGIASIGLVVATFTVATALLPLVRRLIAVGSSAVPQLLDPVLTGGVAVVTVVLLFAIGIATGDTGGGGGVLGIFGVLKRTELDLRPVGNAMFLVAGGYFTSVILGRSRFTDARGEPQPTPILSAVGSGFVLLVLAGLCFVSSRSLDAAPLVSRGIEKQAPLGKLSLAILRRLGDRDHDGFSPRFGGGDCNDRDAKINPGALDIPGNGIDEDCSGMDTPAPPVDTHPEGPAIVTSKVKRPKRSYNVLLITIDTLRTDLGFMGYEKPVSPNLDKLAAKSVVFERAYSMASYTGKSIGPMLIGKYPSETIRDGSHFNTYFAPNTFVTERVHDRGVRTFAAHCHWYFRFPTGLNQGMDVWDTSAIPPGMGDNDVSITSDRETGVAMKLLMNPENVTPQVPSPDLELGDGGLELVDSGVTTLAAPDAGAGEPRRFFGWLHYFDPHAQYVPHEGSPEIKGPWPAKNLYDGEVWYTDQYIGKVLDYVAEQPWAADTAIIVTADHGEAFADHGMSWHGAELWESLVRVPLVVYIPGVTPRRVKVKRSHIDMAPTLLELMGAPLPDDEDALRGTSLLEDVYAEGETHEERDIYMDMPIGPYNGTRRALVTGPTPGMKLIHQGGAVYQLYDLAEDPAEKKDLASDKDKLRPAIDRMNELRSRLKEIEVKPEAP